MSPTDPLLVTDVDAQPLPLDPPPPYPSRQYRPRRSTRRPRIPLDLPEEHRRRDAMRPFPETDHHDVSEGTPLLHNQRQRTVSASSGAPSLAQTVISLFHTESELEANTTLVRSQGSSEDDDQHSYEQDSDLGRSSLFSKRAWTRYFRPFNRGIYYAALFHLLVLNFPFALVAFIYLFVFTLTGTSLLVVLPLGAVLCFLNLVGARAFARGELALQTRFHAMLAYPTPHPFPPIFTRLREPRRSLLHDHHIEEAQRHEDAAREPSFYRNTYAMFTDPTSYQALFYFLVIKPPITLILFLLLLITVPPSFLLVVPAPAVLRAVRKLGVWQANIAIEGLYHRIRR